jgi:acyl-CoA synthetase (AMP-forming)/AMP-acid ligase II
VPSEFGHNVRQWTQAVPAIASSGVLAPVGPRMATKLARSFRQYGPTPAMLLAASAVRHPGRVAIIDDTGQLTYRQLQDRAEAIAAALYAQALSAPRSVGIVCRNHRGFVEALAAGAQLGAELIFINTELPPQQLQAIIARHNPDILIFDDEYTATVDDADYAGMRVLAWHDTGTTSTRIASLDSLATQQHPRPPRVRHAVKITLLTSGTTGLAKGVPRAVKPRAVALLCVTAMARIRLRSSDVFAAAPPFFHGFGLVALLGPLALGGTVIARRRFDAQQTLEDIADHKATVLMGVPIMLQRLLAVPGLDPALVRRSLRIIVTGAAPISPTTVSSVIATFGPILVNGYGSTEAGLLTIATPADLVAAPDTAGRASLGVSVRILSEDRTEVETGETGLIFVRSGLDYTGYSPDATGRPMAKEVIDGHVNTGDMGHLDAARRLYIDGRSDDMIISGGENVFPGEVEDQLTTHPGVTDAVVLGVADPEYGQVLHAFVVTTGAAPTDTELKRHVRASLERHKVPKRFIVVTEIPRNASGKVLRSTLHAHDASPSLPREA